MRQIRNIVLALALLATLVVPSALADGNTQVRVCTFAHFTNGWGNHGVSPVYVHINIQGYGDVAGWTSYGSGGDCFTRSIPTPGVLTPFSWTTSSWPTTAMGYPTGCYTQCSGASAIPANAYSVGVSAYESYSPNR